MSEHLTIGEVARSVGMSTSALRYYERVGLLPKPERVSGQRRYGLETLGRLRTIRACQQAGFSLEDVGQLLRGAEDGRAAEALRQLAKRKLPDVDALIERAQAMKAWLEQAVECRCISLDACVLFGSDEEACPASADSRERAEIVARDGKRN